MNFANSWKKQHEDKTFSSTSPHFITTHSPRPNSTLSFQKSSILPCNIYGQRNSKDSLHIDLTPIYERNEASQQNSFQNSFRPGLSEEHENAVNILDISEELLLSQKNLTSRKQVNSGSLCPSHQKNQDIICMVDRRKICSHCALFGEHKDHTFKSEAQFLEELHAQTMKLDALQEQQNNLKNSSFQQEEWRKLYVECQTKERELLDELNLEFARLFQKIEAAKREIEASIKQQALSVQSTIQQQSEHCKKEIETSTAFAHWMQQGRKIVNRLKEDFDTPQFEQCYGDYDTFAWQQGDYIVRQEKDLVNRLHQNVKKAIDDMRLNLDQHAMQNLSSSLFLASQIQFPSEIDTSITSLDDLHKHLGNLKTEGNENSENEFLNFREFARFRNSECLQTIHEPGRTSIGLFDKSQRMSAKCFAKKTASSTSKKENKPTVGMTGSYCSNLSFLQRQKSNSKLETSIFASKSKMKVVNSPKLPKPKPDPMRVITEYERNQQMVYLNLSDCNLSEDSLAYFLERAGKARLPLQVNLQKNNLSSGGFTKLLPYLVGCTKINLSSCGLGEGCLESLLRTKALKRLEQCNFTGNEINVKKNKTKLEELKKLGIKIICN